MNEKTGKDRSHFNRILEWPPNLYWMNISGFFSSFQRAETNYAVVFGNYLNMFYNRQRLIWKILIKNSVFSALSCLADFAFFFIIFVQRREYFPSRARLKWSGSIDRRRGQSPWLDYHLKCLRIVICRWPFGIALAISIFSINCGGISNKTSDGNENCFNYHFCLKCKTKQKQREKLKAKNGLMLSRSGRRIKQTSRI